MAETRKLAAILAADVAGYSKLAGADEERTLARLRALRSDLIDPTIALHHGRVVKRTGDDVLIESSMPSAAPSRSRTAALAAVGARSPGARRVCPDRGRAAPCTLRLKRLGPLCSPNAISYSEESHHSDLNALPCWRIR